MGGGIGVGELLGVGRRIGRETEGSGGVSFTGEDSGGEGRGVGAVRG